MLAEYLLACRTLNAIFDQAITQIAWEAISQAVAYFFQIVDPIGSDSDAFVTMILTKLLLDVETRMIFRFRDDL